MAYSFPNTFSEEVMLIDERIDEMPAGALTALDTLRHAGITVQLGVTRGDVEAITTIAGQLGVREFCPNDLETRFGNEQMMRGWLDKNGGRGMFLPRNTDHEIVGYGWTGLESNEHLPECDTTFAVRLSASEAGKGLGAPLTTVIYAGSVALFGCRRVGLESWESNVAAIKSYQKAGAELVAVEDGERPTYNGNLENTPVLRKDRRYFMQFPEAA
jgi:ribosomal protein S18 acetylase RimI-like enzyme